MHGVVRGRPPKNGRSQADGQAAGIAGRQAEAVGNDRDRDGEAGVQVERGHLARPGQRRREQAGQAVTAVLQVTPGCSDQSGRSLAFASALAVEIASAPPPGPPRSRPPRSPPPVRSPGAGGDCPPATSRMARLGAAPTRPVTERGKSSERPSGARAPGHEFSNCRMAATVSTAAVTAAGSAPVSARAPPGPRLAAGVVSGRMVTTMPATHRAPPHVGHSAAAGAPPWRAGS